MIYSRFSNLTGRENTMDIDITQYQADLIMGYIELDDPMEMAMNIPNLNEDEERFLQDGIMPFESIGNLFMD